ncbi:MAG TPA: hypothetical protein VEU29_03845, partial [Actinomycetota bacterium]|nr:hypothetical protein [Actinomycetota bacterium]
HTERGIQIESLWGFAQLLASKFGYAVGINFSFGALHVDSSVEPVLKALAQVLSLGFVVAGVWLANRARRSGGEASGPEIAGIMFMTMAGTMAAGSVFSPQFMLWLGALAAAVLCEPKTWLRIPALAVLPAALMTQFIYPFFYGRLVAIDTPALVLLGSRNLLVMFIAVEAFLALRGRTGATAPEADPAPAAVGEAEPAS